MAHHFSNGREIKKGDIFIYTDKKGIRRRGKVTHLTAGPEKSITTIPMLPADDTLALLKESLHSADAPKPAKPASSSSIQHPASSIQHRFRPAFDTAQMT